MTIEILALLKVYRHLHIIARTFGFNNIVKCNDQTVNISKYDPFSEIIVTSINESTHIHIHITNTYTHKKKHSLVGHFKFSLGLFPFSFWLFDTCKLSWLHGDVILKATADDDPCCKYNNVMWTLLSSCY